MYRVGDWIFSPKRHSTTISPDRDAVYAFDLEGRPLSWYEGGRVFKRSLGSAVHGRERAGGGRRRWVASRDEAGELFGRLLRRVALAPVDGMAPRLRSRLDDILRWTPSSLLDERRRFESVYEPISILPPDHYLSTVIQATFGCSWNRCTFCSFYQDRPFRVRPPESLRPHVRAVKDLLGRGERLRPRIFLADGNALILSNDRLRPIFTVVRESFPGKNVGGFVDVFSGERKPAAEWTELRALGLESVCVGLETGHAPLLAWLNKPGDPERGLDLVSALKAAGLRVSVIVMCGVGGERFARAHVSDTIGLVSRMPLAGGDIVYLSPFVVNPESTYARRAAEERVRPMDDVGRDEQYGRLRDAIRRRLPGVKVARYDIGEFVY